MSDACSAKKKSLIQNDLALKFQIFQNSLLKTMKSLKVKRIDLLKKVIPITQFHEK